MEVLNVSPVANDAKPVCVFSFVSEIRNREMF